MDLRGLIAIAAAIIAGLLAWSSLTRHIAGEFRARREAAAAEALEQLRREQAERREAPPPRRDRSRVVPGEDPMRPTHL